MMRLESCFWGEEDEEEDEALLLLLYGPIRESCMG